MSDPDWVPGKTLEIGVTQIRAYEIEPTFLNSLGRGDGAANRLGPPPTGQFGSINTWGPTTGPRRGEGQGKTIRDLPALSASQVFFEETAVMADQVEREYAALAHTLSDHIKNELDAAKEHVKKLQLPSALEDTKNFQMIVLSLIEQKIINYQQLTHAAFSLYDQNPFYLMKELSSKRVQEALTATTRDARATFYEAYQSIEYAYKAAHELKLHSGAIELLSKELPELAIRQASLEQENATFDTDVITLLNNRTRVINSELNIHFQQLAYFLQEAITTRTSSLNNLSHHTSSTIIYPLLINLSFSTTPLFALFKKRIDRSPRL